MNDKELRALLDEEARAAEEASDEDDGQPLPAHVTVSRPNRARSKVLQVRLNPEEFEAIEAIAQRRGLPASTVARERLLQMIHEDEGPLPSPADVAVQLAGVAEQLMGLVPLVRAAGIR